VEEVSEVAAEVTGEAEEASVVVAVAVVVAVVVVAVEEEDSLHEVAAVVVAVVAEVRTTHSCTVHLQYIAGLLWRLHFIADCGSVRPLFTYCAEGALALSHQNEAQSASLWT